MSNYIPKPSIFDPDEKGQFGMNKMKASIRRREAVTIMYLRIAHEDTDHQFRIHLHQTGRF